MLKYQVRAGKSAAFTTMRRTFARCDHGRVASGYGRVCASDEPGLCADY